MVLEHSLFPTDGPCGRMSYPRRWAQMAAGTPYGQEQTARMASEPRSMLHWPDTHRPFPVGGAALIC